MTSYLHNIKHQEKHFWYKLLFSDHCLGNVYNRDLISLWIAIFQWHKQQGHEIGGRDYCEYPPFPNKIGLNHRNLVTERYNSITIYSMRTLMDQILTSQMFTRVILAFAESPKMDTAASESTVFLLLRDPPPSHGLWRQYFYLVFQLWNSVEQGQLHGHTTYAVVQDLMLSPSPNLSNFWTQNPTFSFYIGPLKLWN